MIRSSLQRGFAASIISAAFVIGSGAALAQPATKAKPTPAKTAPAKTTPAKGTAAAKPAAQKPAASAAPASGPGGATLLASFGDWGVYIANTGKSKICYALSQPKERLPKNLNRDPAYMFVSIRPAENVKNEVAFVLGYGAKDTAKAEATIGAANYVLLTQGANAWLKNPAEEGQAIATMGKGQAVLVKGQSARGNQLSDRYSLSGFGQALDRARKECP
ncbi:hypothetical protein [Microvirga flavescens]|uniref:hypothetical protein n=1 Tax=Microvirga flavescens TaxID=2249811 RepID=UPI0018E0BF9E|nr:hypothetical protein [Microvirga flavescens]